MKKAKYRNKRVEIDGLKFDSEKEGKRYLFLKQAESRGLITDLRRQVTFELQPKITETYTKQLKTKKKECERTIQLPITYKGDFVYFKNGIKVVEDVKASPRVASLDKVFLIKEKMFRYKFGFSIKRVYKDSDPI